VGVGPGTEEIREDKTKGDILMPSVIYRNSADSSSFEKSAEYVSLIIDNPCILFLDY
jgi:hypothetical protein